MNNYFRKDKLHKEIKQVIDEIASIKSKLIFDVEMFEDHEDWSEYSGNLGTNLFYAKRNLKKLEKELEEIEESDKNGDINTNKKVGIVTYTQEQMYNMQQKFKNELLETAELHTNDYYNNNCYINKCHNKDNYGFKNNKNSNNNVKYHYNGDLNDPFYKGYDNKGRNWEKSVPYKGSNSNDKYNVSGYGDGGGRNINNSKGVYIETEEEMKERRDEIEGVDDVRSYKLKHGDPIISHEEFVNGKYIKGVFINGELDLEYNTSNYRGNYYVPNYQAKMAKWAKDKTSVKLLNVQAKTFVPAKKSEALTYVDTKKKLIEKQIEDKKLLGIAEDTITDLTQYVDLLQKQVNVLEEKNDARKALRNIKRRNKNKSVKIKEEYDSEYSVLNDNIGTAGASNNIIVGGENTIKIKQTNKVDELMNNVVSLQNQIAILEKDKQENGLLMLTMGSSTMPRSNGTENIEAKPIQRSLNENYGTNLANKSVIKYNEMLDEILHILCERNKDGLIMQNGLYCDVDMEIANKMFNANKFINTINSIGVIQYPTDQQYIETLATYIAKLQLI